MKTEVVQAVKYSVEQMRAGGSREAVRRRFLELGMPDRAISYVVHELAYRFGKRANAASKATLRAQERARAYFARMERIARALS